jgi:hypothetical protein
MKVRRSICGLLPTPRLERAIIFEMLAFFHWSGPFFKSVENGTATPGNSSHRGTLSALTNWSAGFWAMLRTFLQN